jgi:hypothetical protein
VRSVVSVTVTSYKYNGMDLDMKSSESFETQIMCLEIVCVASCSVLSPCLQVVVV